MGIKKTEHNNKEKELTSRPGIAIYINNFFNNKKIKMLELLGDGTGVKYYLEKCNILNMFAIERHKKNVSIFLENNNIKDDPLKIYRMQLNKFFNKYKDYIKFNVINLDFCAYLYDNGESNCTASVIRNMFNSNILEDNSLVIMTFQLKGMGVNFSKSKAIIDIKDIALKIKELSANTKYDVSLDEDFVIMYRSSYTSIMGNFFVKVKLKDLDNE